MLDLSSSLWDSLPSGKLDAMEHRLDLPSNKTDMEYHWIGLREKLQETSIFSGKNNGFL